MGEACRLTVVHDKFDGETKTYREVEHGWSVEDPPPTREPGASNRSRLFYVSARAP